MRFCEIGLNKLQVMAAGIQVVMAQDMLEREDIPAVSQVLYRESVSKTVAGPGVNNGGSIPRMS